MLTPPSDVIALNPVLGEVIEFSFTDNPDWRSKTNFIIAEYGISSGFYQPWLNRDTPGLLSPQDERYSVIGEYIFTINATGYAAKVFKVTVTEQ